MYSYSSHTTSRFTLPKTAPRPAAPVMYRHGCSASDRIATSLRNIPPPVVAGRRKGVIAYGGLLWLPSRMTVTDIFATLGGMHESKCIGLTSYLAAFHMGYPTAH